MHRFLVSACRSARTTAKSGAAEEKTAVQNALRVFKKHENLRDPVSKVALIQPDAKVRFEQQIRLARFVRVLPSD